MWSQGCVGWSWIGIAGHPSAARGAGMAELAKVPLSLPEGSGCIQRLVVAGPDGVGNLPHWYSVSSPESAGLVPDE